MHFVLRVRTAINIFIYFRPTVICKNGQTLLVKTVILVLITMIRQDQPPPPYECFLNFENTFKPISNNFERRKEEGRGWSELGLSVFWFQLWIFLRKNVSCGSVSTILEVVVGFSASQQRPQGFNEGVRQIR